jgi:cyclopropane-fatty-acyl-phospholipid synthase
LFLFRLSPVTFHQVYTSGIYENGDEDLMTAQLHKLDYVANAINLQPGENVLDIGCGWGRLAKVFSEKFKANVWGVTLSQDQIDWAKANLDLNDNVHLMLQNAMTMDERTDLPDGGKFDKITSVSFRFRALPPPSEKSNGTQTSQLARRCRC